MGLKREYMSMNLYQRGKHRKLLPLQLLPMSSSRTWHPEEGRHGHGHSSHNSSAAGDSLLHTPADSRSTTPSRSTFTSVESSCEDFGARKDVRKDWGRGHLYGAGACLGGGGGSGGGSGGGGGGGDGGSGGCSGNCGAGGSGGAPIGLAVGLGGGGGADTYASSFDYNAFDPKAFLPPPPPPPPLRRDLSFSEELAAALEKASYEGHLEDEEVERTPWSEADDEADLEADRRLMYNAPAEVSDFPTYLAPACSVTVPRRVLRHNTVEACTGAAPSAARGTSAASAASAASASAASADDDDYDEAGADNMPRGVLRRKTEEVSRSSADTLGSAPPPEYPLARGLVSGLSSAMEAEAQPGWEDSGRPWQSGGQHDARQSGYEFPRAGSTRRGGGGRGRRPDWSVPADISALEVTQLCNLFLGWRVRTVWQASMLKVRVLVVHVLVVRLGGASWWCLRPRETHGVGHGLLHALHAHRRSAPFRPQRQHSLPPASPI